jgi:WD40 repeat protein
VAGLRADFYGEVTADPELAGAVAKNQVVLGPMSDDDLRRAICEPARVAGLRLDSGLVDLVLRDVGGEPGALPLMSHALRETWERRTGRSLTVDAYRASGGVSSALAQTADVVVQRTPASERPLLRGLFLRLSNVGDGVEDTRNRVPVDELIPEGSSPEAVQTLLTRLADARLVMLDQGTAELAHEVLIRRWPTLRRWLDEDRDALQLHRRLGDAARLWDDAGRDPTDLYRGARLAATVDCASADRAQLNHTERAFLNASVEEATRTERRRRLANRRLRRALAAAGVLLLAAVGLLVFALSSRHDAVTAEASAKSRAIAAEAESQLSRDPALALLLARRALAIAATPEAMLATSGALDADPLRSQLPSFGVQGCVTANYMYLLNHGRLAVDNTCDGHVVFADLAAHKIVKRMSIGDASTDMTLSPDGQTLTIASGRRLVGLDVASGRVRPLFLAPFPIAWIAHGASPYLVISDGESVALADPSTGSVRVIARGDATANAILGMLWVAPQRLLIETSGHSQGHGDLFPGVTVLDVAHGTRQRVALPVAPNHLADLAFLNMTQDHRTWFLTGAETDPYSGQEVATTWAVDARTRRIRWIARGGPGQAASVNPSPDGRVVAVGDSLGAVDVLDAQTGRRISRDAGTASISAGWMAFAPGDSTLVTVSLDGVFRTWAQGKAELRLQIPADPAVDFSPDGNHLVLVGDRGEIVDSSTGAVVRTTGGFPASSIFAACSSNCFAATPGLRRLTYLNPAAATTRIVEIDGETGRRIADIGVPRLDAQSVAPDGRIATAYVDTGRLYAQLTDPASTRTRQLEPGPSSAGCQATTPSFTPDSRLMAIVDGCIHLVVWDVRTSRVKRAVALPNLDNAAGAPGAGITATGARITPDGRYALVAIEGGGLVRIDLANDSYSQLPGTRTITRALAISPNGRFYAIGRDDGNVDVYDARTLQLVRRHAIDNPIQALAFSPNSRELAVEDTSNVLWVWDTCDVCENPTRLAQLAAQESVRTLTPSERASFGVS